jgi:hypothetical protein
MTSPLYPIPGVGGIARGNDSRQLRDQLEQSTHGAGGTFRSTRGTFRMRRRGFFRGMVWPGYGYVGAERYIDADSLSAPTELETGTAITDNSSGVKEWIKVSLGADTVTFETNGPAANPHGVDEVWFYVPHLTGPFYVSRTG